MTDFDNLRAPVINCTLKRAPEPSNTQGLIDVSARIMERNGVKVSHTRAVKMALNNPARDHGRQNRTTTSTSRC
ncbi:hypothetical protein [Nocardia xishanensis]